jgi:hypothetical protein
MLKIRKEQYEDLGKISLKRFEDSMVEHVKKFFPKYYEIYEEPLIRKVIRYAVDRAESYDLITERDVCLYINLMFLLGSNFDTDLQLTWAGVILNDEKIVVAFTRIDRLHDEGMEYLDQVSGIDNEYLGSALLRVREISIEDFAQTPTPNTGDIAAMHLRKIWRRKCQKMGETTLRKLIRDAIESAKAYNITTERGVVLYTTLMFLLGSGFDKDPQFPWAIAVLNDESIPDESARVDRLYKEAMAFLEKWLT